MPVIRQMEPRDFGAIPVISRKIYPNVVPWNPEQLASHLSVFAEGQFVAVEGEQVVGYAASLIVFWDDYEFGDNWRDFTGHGLFTNHDPERGRTLYAADVMVDPDFQGRGVGKLLYRGREELLRRRKLLRIRAGARLQGYSEHAYRMTPEKYVLDVVHGRLSDRTLSFQLRRGFKVLGVVGQYIRNDAASLGYAAVIEYLNPEIAGPEDRLHQRQSPYYK
jgi:GNAT superfamily N-acetyltransferase